MKQSDFNRPEGQTTARWLVALAIIGSQTTARWLVALAIGSQTTAHWLVFPEDLEEAAEMLAER